MFWYIASFRWYRPQKSDQKQFFVNISIGTPFRANVQDVLLIENFMQFIVCLDTFCSKVSTNRDIHKNCFRPIYKNSFFVNISIVTHFRAKYVETNNKLHKIFY